MPSTTVSRHCSGSTAGTGSASQLAVGIASGSKDPVSYEPVKRRVAPGSPPSRTAPAAAKYSPAAPAPSNPIRYVPVRALLAGSRR